MSDIINIILIALVLLLWFLIIKKFIQNRFSPVKTAEAEVFDKYEADSVSKHPGTFKQKNYIVVFKTSNKKLSFNVSEFSYQSYRLNDKGTLKYKGSRIIDFK